MLSRHSTEAQKERERIVDTTEATEHARGIGTCAVFNFLCVSVVSRWDEDTYLVSEELELSGTTTSPDWAHLKVVRMSPST